MVRQKTGKIIKCFTCGKEIYRPKSRLKAYERHYCSRKCQNKSPYKREISSKRMKKNNPMCDQKIKNIAYQKILEYWRTHKSPNFIDGSSRNRRYTRGKWLRFAKEIYKRDHYTCQICGKKGGLLNAHHILPWAGNPQGAFDKNNVITLCTSCHNKIHRRKLKL